jgi:hypothetical protein
MKPEKKPLTVISMTREGGKLGMATFDLFYVSGKPHVNILDIDGSLIAVPLDPLKLKSLPGGMQSDFGYEGLIVLDPPQRN